MSFPTNPPMNRSTDQPPQGGASFTNQPPPNPVFRPDFVRSLRMHPVAAAVTAAIVLVLILAVALREQPSYEAEALVDISPGVAHILDEGQAGLFDSNRYDSSIAQQIQTAERLDILTGVVESLPVGTWRQPGESTQAAATRLQAALKIQRVATSYQVSFTLKGPSPQKTADTLNATVDAFLVMGRKDALTASGQRIDILNEERGRIQAELIADRKEQALLSTALGVANPGFDTGNPYDAQLSGLRTELASAREQHEIAAAQLASVTGSGSTNVLGLTAASEDLIAGDAGLSSMRATISQRRATLAGLMAGLTPENPIYKQDQGEIADLDRSLDSMTTQLRNKAALHLQDKLRTDLARTGDVEARLNAQLAAQTYAATSASPKLQRATELTAELQRLMRRYASVDDTLRSLQLDSTAPGAAHLALAATAPLTPAPSRKRLLLFAAIPLAAICGLLVAVFLRKRDSHVYTGPDVNAVVGFPPLAVLPDAADVSTAVMAEYILRLAGGVENAYRASGARTFVLTAVSDGLDTRATIVIPLETRLSQLGLRVATVTGVQVMNAAFAEVGGYKPLALAQGPGEGIAPRNLDLIKMHADLVLIDTLPLLRSAETEYLVRCADATILLARSGVTLCAELKSSANLLENLHVKGIAAVLEGVQLRYADSSFRATIASLDARPTTTYASPETPIVPSSTKHTSEFVHSFLSSLTPEATPSESILSKPEMTLETTPIDMPIEAPDHASLQAQPVDVSIPASTAEAANDLLQGQQAPDVQHSAVPPFVDVTEQHDHDVSNDSSPQDIASLDPIATAPPPPPSVAEDHLPPSIQPSSEDQATPSFNAASPETVTVRPLTNFTFVEPPRRNWFQRLFVREEFSLLNTSPVDDQAHQPALLSQTEPIQTRWQPLYGQEADGEADIARLLSGPMKVTSQADRDFQQTPDKPLVTTPEQDPIAVVDPVLYDQPTHEAVHETVIPFELQEHKPEADHNKEDSPASIAEAAPHPLHGPPELVEARLAEVGVDEPAHDASNDTEPILPLAPAPIQLVPQALSAAPISIERPAAVLQEPVRTARWDPSPLSRTDITPWRDRRVAAPNAEYSEPERRFNWNAANSPAKPIAMVTPRTPERRQPEPERPAQPSRLTRNWGLLSRFGDLHPPTPDDPAQGGEGNSSRNYRRG